MKKLLIFAVRLFLAAPLIFSISACSNFKRKPDDAQSRVARPEPTDIERFEFSMPRSDLKRIIETPGGLAGIRLIQIYARDSDFETKTPEYRVFEVRPGTAYEALGLRNNDVLVTVNGYSVTAPNNFAQFVRHLSNEAGGWFEIRRAGDPLLLKFQITD